MKPPPEGAAACGAAPRAPPEAAARKPAALIGRRALRIDRARLALIGARVVIVARRGRRRRWAAAEQGLADAAEETGLLLRRRGLRLRLKLGEAPAGVFQRLLLHQHGLRQHVRRIRRGADGVVDKSLRLGIARRRSGRADAFEQAGEHLAFFGGHGFLPFGLKARAKHMGDDQGRSKVGPGADLREIFVMRREARRRASLPERQAMCIMLSTYTH